MSSTTPYDPTLIIGNVVSQDQLDNLTQIATRQAPADAEADRRQSLEAILRSLDMTAQELENMGIDAGAVKKQREEIAALLR